jgi:hypothetical protein
MASKGTAAALEGRTELFAEGRRGLRMPGRGPRMRVEDAEHDLADDVRGKRQQLVLGRGATRGVGQHQKV